MNNQFLWIALSSLSASLPPSPSGVCFFLNVHAWIFFFCLYEPQLETAADRDSRGEATSVRLNAICEVRCVIDLSGPWSLFSISIYLPSQQHIPVSPFCPTRARQLFCSQTDIHTLIHPHPHTKRKTEWSWHSPSSKCKLPDVDIRTRGDHGNMQIYCSPISEVDLIILSPLLPGSYFSLCVTCWRPSLV